MRAKSIQIARMSVSVSVSAFKILLPPVDSQTDFYCKVLASAPITQWAVNLIMSWIP